MRASTPGIHAAMTRILAGRPGKRVRNRLLVEMTADQEVHGGDGVAGVIVDQVPAGLDGYDVRLAPVEGDARTVLQRSRPAPREVEVVVVEVDVPLVLHGLGLEERAVLHLAAVRVA